MRRTAANALKGVMPIVLIRRSNILYFLMISRVDERPKGTQMGLVKAPIMHARSVESKLATRRENRLIRFIVISSLWIKSGVRTYNPRIQENMFIP